MKTSTRLSVFGIVIVGAVAFVYFYWQHSLRYPSTDDAYIQANIVRISAQVSGPLTQLHVTENAHVTAGQSLLDIDARPYEIALRQAQAALEMARHEIASAEAAVDESAARVEQFRTQLRDIEANARRVVPMVDSQLLPQSEGDNMRFAAENARAALNAAIAEHDRAMRILGVRGEANVRLKQAKAIVAKAELDLENTHITAPADGIVAEINVRPGSMVERGKSLFALVEDRDWWVEANYKETDLERIRAGQSADISIDIYPGLSLKGMVESVSPASGVSFSLLPPENAVGNWVKVTQRFPVRIRIIATDAQHPLRVGASCEVSVDTQSQTPS